MSIQNLRNKYKEHPCFKPLIDYCEEKNISFEIMKEAVVKDTYTIKKTYYMKVDDIVETTNHFRCIDMIIDKAEERLTEGFIKELHRILKSGTSDSLKSWFAVGDYKKIPNEVGGIETVSPENTKHEIVRLLKEYNAIKKKTFDDILGFHQRFELIHPFQDGNGRVGRLIMFKECLANGIVPFIITDELKMFYYRGLQQWPQVKEYLLDTYLTAQDNYKMLLDYFKIKY